MYKKWGVMTPLTPIYEPPVSPEIHLNTDVKNIKECKFFVCGPPMMMESVKLFSEKKDIECDVALETLMACGFGICQGCTVEFKNNNNHQHSYRDKYGLVCCDGPIFNAKDIKTCLL